MKRPAKTTITSRSGAAASPLGLAVYPGQKPACVPRAFERGINYFFFYSLGHKQFVAELLPLVRKRPDSLIIATGSGSRKPDTLARNRRKVVATLGLDVLDVFYAEYINPADDPQAIFGPGGVLDELAAWKADGLIRYAGATAHDRRLAARLAADPRVDILMHRFNMAHRKAASGVFPAARKSGTPIVAFTATRWGTLLEPRSDFPTGSPSAADCYRYCLANPAVQIALTAPKTVVELDENLTLIDSPPMSEAERLHWERYGDLVHGNGADAFETQWL
jgi:aryl-alcohol dehydrogenase-like predicted oxidoreductase